MTVYFVEAVAPPGLVKIGMAGDVRKRVMNLAAASPVPLKLLAHMPGEKREEWDLHWRLAKHRHHGEWFSPHEDVLACVAEAKYRNVARVALSSYLSPRIGRFKSCPGIGLAADYHPILFAFQLGQRAREILNRFNLHVPALNMRGMTAGVFMLAPLAPSDSRFVSGASLQAARIMRSLIGRIMIALPSH